MRVESQLLPCILCVPPQNIVLWNFFKLYLYEGPQQVYA
jgi:hypothetical protein